MADLGKDNKEDNGGDGDSLLSIPTVGEVDEEEDEEVMDGRNASGKMVVDGVLVPEDVYVPAFAIDVAAVARGTNLKDLRESVQWALDKIQAWVAEAALELSPTKSVAVFFIKGKLANVNFPGKLRVNGEEIEYSHEARYLCVQLDRKLNFRAHIDLKIKKARQHIMKLQSFHGQVVGAQSLSHTVGVSLRG